MPAGSSRTCRAFLELLPFQRTFLHARVSGREIWIDDAPELKVPQENASVFTVPGEIVIGPVFPERNRIRNCIGIFYGPGQLLDCGNIFVVGTSINKNQISGVGSYYQWRRTTCGFTRKTVAGGQGLISEVFEASEIYWLQL